MPTKPKSAGVNNRDKKIETTIVTPCFKMAPIKLCFTPFKLYFLKNSLIDSIYLFLEYLKVIRFKKNVFSMIMQMADKSRSVPYYVKKIANNSAKSEIDRLNYATKGNLSINQLAKKRQLETKAFEEKELPFPLAQPNPTQTWGDIISLFKVYMKTTGNFYL